MSIALIEPWELGLGERYKEFRQCQVEAVDYVMERGERFIGLGCPPGSGKTLIAAAIAKATGWRTVVLTSTRGLQDQYMKTLPCWDIKGKDNYDCSELDAVTCRFGKQEGCKWHRKVKNRAGEVVDLADPRCVYESKKRTAQWEPFVDTNYSYWFRANQFTRGLEPPPDEGHNPVELLILDEAHLAFDELSKSLGLVLQEKRLVDLGWRADEYPQKDLGIEVWAGWAGRGGDRVKELIEDATAKLKETKGTFERNKARDKVFKLEEFKEGLDKLTRMNGKDWVLDRQEGTEHGRRWQFDCIWPSGWAESRLFFGIPKVVLMSGTLRPETMRLLGIKKDVSAFREWPRQFPPQNTPIYHVRTVKLNSKATVADLDTWVGRIDEILDAEFEAGNKGIIHTVSYDRQTYLHDHSRFSEYFHMNTKDKDSPDAIETVELFRKAGSPAALVSPSFSTGWDFPDDDARFIIVAKIPFPDFRSKVMQARLERWRQYIYRAKVFDESSIPDRIPDPSTTSHRPKWDLLPSYTDYLCMQELVQGTQRGSRHDKDWCRVYIVDDALTFLLSRAKVLAPSWFKVIRVNEVPQIRD